MFVSSSFLRSLKRYQPSFPTTSSFSTKVLKYPGFNQVILSKGKTKINTSAQFYEIAQEFGKLMIQNPQIPRFDLLKDLKDPSSFIFMEVYNGPGVFQQHVESQEFDQFQVVAEPLLEDEFELEEFQTIYPMQVSILSSDLPADPSLPPSLPPSLSVGH
jgi:quinol monooxygenase YgiN